MAEMALGYGSEFQLLRYLGHHRESLNTQIQNVIGEGSIKWLDYPIDLMRDSLDGEHKGIECFKNLPNYNYNVIEQKWKEFWPQRGNCHNWDGIFIQNDIWYFVEAKANLEEANQRCNATSEKSIKIIRKAFEQTCGDINLAQEWQKSDCYQLANRLAFIHFCTTVGIKAKLLYINFIKGYRINPKQNVESTNDWKKKWEDEYKVLKLSKDLEANIHHVYIDCEKC